jgi:UDPglucose 6-dehydrogenase
MRIAVVGTGYVGLVAAACFAENGNTVVCLDTDVSKVNALKRGRLPIYEPGLEELVRRNRAEKRLTFTTVLPRAVRASEVIFVAVGTPSGTDGAADVRPVLDAAREIARAMHGYTVIVVKSTVPAGTSQKVREVVRRETTHPFSVVSNPEFLKQGAAIEDFMKPDRVVIGAADDRAAQLMRDLYAPFTRTGAPVLVMDCASAELSKYAADAMLATRISFMNEVANVCDRVGANVDHVRRAIAADRRIGPAFLFPGIGYGGSCLPKDVRAVVRFAADAGYDFLTLQAVEAVNQRQTVMLVERMERELGGLGGLTIAVWGLAFKPRTDNVREAPALVVIDRLLAAGARVRAYDPAAREAARRMYGARVALAESSYDALAGADALAVVTEWNEFREPDFQRMKKLLKSPAIFDGRNIYAPDQMKALGFRYFSVGR